MEDPIHPAMTALTTPEEDEARLRAILPPWQKNYTSDDYTEYTWHCPTAHVYVGRAMLASPRPGYQYPAWVWNALGGFPATIDPTVQAAARAIAGSLTDLMTDPQALGAAQAEFRERTGGGIGGTKWVAPAPAEGIPGADPLPLAGICQHAPRCGMVAPAGRVTLRQLSGRCSVGSSDLHSESSHKAPIRNPRRHTDWPKPM